MEGGWMDGQTTEGRPRENQLPSTGQQENHDKTFKQQISEFMGYTSAHGIGRLGDSKTIFWKIFWTVVCLGAFAMFFYEVNGLFELYLSKPVSSLVKITFEKKLKFPAVTICNLNMMHVDGAPSEVLEFIQKSKTDTSSSDDGKPDGAEPEVPKELITQKSKTGNSSSDDGKPETGRRRRNVGTGDKKDVPLDDLGGDGVKGDDYGSYTDYDDYDYGYDYDYDYDYYSDDISEGLEDIGEEYPDANALDLETRLRIKVTQIVASKDPSQLYITGHLFHDMVLNCTWKGIDCKDGNMSKSWKTSWNYKYGNCFTFNGGYDYDNNPVRVLSSSKPGPSQGLVLQLNVEQSKYIGPLTIEAGIRVLLHDQGEMPFPYEEGFSVSPGIATSVGIRKTRIVRLDRFSNQSCLAAHGLAETNIYRKYRNVSVYSQQACLNSCLGSSQNAICGCSEAVYPSKGDPCDVFNTTTAKCLKFVKRLFNDDKLKCLDDCRQPCTEEVILKTISSTKWPSKSYKAYLASKGQSVNKTDDLLLLNIFFNELNYQNIEEEFAYGSINLLADIGGQLGLWIGISALTCCELLELFMKMISHLVKKCDKRNDVNKVSP